MSWRAAALPFLLLALSGNRALADDAMHIKPEMIVRVPKSGAAACLSRDGLNQVLDYMAEGQWTKARAMMVDHEGDCLMLTPKQRLKVLSVEYNNPDVPFGIMEVTEEKSDATLNGAWTLTAGVEILKPPPHSEK